MSADYSKLTRAELERIAAAAESHDPLMNLNNIRRDFEPTMDDVMQYLLHGHPYRVPHAAKERFTFTMHPDRLAALKTFSSDHDLSASEGLDLLLRVALGDYDEWTFEATPKTNKEAKKS